MKIKKLNSFFDVLSIPVTAISFILLSIEIVQTLGISYELTVAIISLLASLIIGIYSMYFARFARKLSRSPRVFLSYAHSDSSFARVIADKLNNAGAKVWIDNEQILLGDSIESSIKKAIMESDSFVILLSGVHSNYLNYELTIAKEQNKKIVPVILENIELPSYLKDLKYLNLTSHKESDIQQLVEAVT